MIFITADYVELRSGMKVYKWGNSSSDEIQIRDGTLFVGGCERTTYDISNDYYVSKEKADDRYRREHFPVSTRTMATGVEYDPRAEATVLIALAESFDGPFYPIGVDRTAIAGFVNAARNACLPEETKVRRVLLGKYISFESRPKKQLQFGLRWEWIGHCRDIWFNFGLFQVHICWYWHDPLQ